MDELLDAASEALATAYAPYSNYRVGAAIETADGTVYTGCNVEIANYSNILHAEELALGSAVADGYQDFTGLAVVSSERDGVTPCGMCRQTLAEFCGDEFPIVCADATTTKTYTLGELLPHPITRSHLDGEPTDAIGGGDR